MAAIQYLVPGGTYINEGTSQIEYLVPGGAYVDETSVAAGGWRVHRYGGAPELTACGSRWPGGGGRGSQNAGAAFLAGSAPSRLIGTVLTPGGMRRGTER